MRDPPGVGQAALARLVIGNCNYEESADGVAVTDGTASPEPVLAPYDYAGRVAERSPLRRLFR